MPAVLPRAIVCAGFGVFISALYQAGWPVGLPVLGSLVPSIVLGLLLVFRTNTAYERFWEGRKLWGHLVNTNRNLARHMWVSIQEQSPRDRAEKQQAIRLLVAYALATKLHLREEPLDDEIDALLIAPSAGAVPLLTQQQFDKLKSVHHPPLEVALWIADYLQSCRNRGLLHPYQLAATLSQLDQMVNVLGSCERILRTPIPLAYTIHLKQLLMLYCIALPFQVVDALQWGTGFVVALVSFAVFRIEAIGIEIENPFGRDPNDLPLDAICRNMHRNIEDMMTVSPRLHSSDLPFEALPTPSHRSLEE